MLVKKAYKLLSFENRSVLYSRDVKFYETVFPYEMSQNVVSKCDSEISSLNFLDNIESETTPKTFNREPPNDDNNREGSTPVGRDDRVHQPDEAVITQLLVSVEQIQHPVFEDDAQSPRYDEIHPGTPLDENLMFEGNVGSSNDVHGLQNVFESQTEDGSHRRSKRSSTLHAKLNDYVLDTKVRYGLNKYANHSLLSADN